MIRELVVLAALGTAFVASGAPAAASASRLEGARTVARPDHLSTANMRALDNLLERSGLQVQLESLSAGVRVRFLRGPGRLSGRDRVTIDRIVSERFAAEALYARIRLEFERNLDAAKLAKVLEWFDSPLGRRITGLELAAPVSDGGLDAVVGLGHDRLAPRRLGLIERLDTGGGASETTVDVTMAILRGLTRAFQPAVTRPSRGRLEEEFAQARNRTLEQIKHACLVGMLSAYRSLSEQELEQYAQLVESEAGQWYMSVMNNTLVTAVDVAAEATAAELVTAVPQLVGDLR